jgi:hypothetical protein
LVYTFSAQEALERREASMKTSRAERAGKALAAALTEMVHLMYQENTAKNFMKGVGKFSWKPKKPLKGGK